MIVNWLTRIFQSSYFKSVLTLSSGTTLAQLISIGAAPILYRIYSKEDYGTLGLYLAISSVLGVFSNMNYAEAILLEKKDDDAKVVLWLNRFINMLFAAIIALLVVPVSEVAANWLGNPSIRFWLYLLPVSVFFGGQNAILRVWANRKMEYKLLAINGIVNALAVPIVSISIGYFVMGPLGLFVGLLVGQITPSLFLLFTLSRKDDINSSVYRTKKGWVDALKKYKKFPIYGVPAGLLGRLTNQMPVFLISSFLGPAVVGLYNLSTRLLSLPVQVIGESVSEVFRQRATKDALEGALNKTYRKTLFSLLGISVIPALIILLFGPDIFGFVFGSEWRESGEIAQVLMILYLAKFIVSPLTYIYILRQKLEEDLVLQLSVIAMSSSILYFGFSMNYDYLKVLLLYASCYSVFYMFYLIRSYKMVDLPDKRI